MSISRQNRLIIIGASGHGKVIADIAELSGYSEIVFFDDDASVKNCGSYPVSTIPEELPDGDVIIAIGNPKVRRSFMEKYGGRHFPVLIHPDAVVAKSVKLGEGTVVMAGAVINAETVTGRGCIINTCSSADHDCRLGDYVHIAVGAHLCGTVAVGDFSWIGAGAVVSNNVSVCADCTVGAGAVVIKDIEESGTYAGVPAVLLSGNK